MTSLNVLINHDIMSLTPNTRLADGSTPWSILSNIAPGLLRFDEVGAIQPDLAESWEHDENYTRFRFRLRRKVVLHSGAKLTPELVAWNFRRLFTGKMDTLFDRDFSSLQSVKTIGEQDIEFRFAQPNPDFPNYLAWRMSIIDDVADQPVGAGPYRLARWDRGRSIVLEAFEDYYRPGLPLTQELVITWAASAEEKIRAIREGRADVIESVPVLAAESLRREGVLAYETADSSRRAALVMNTSDGVLSNPALRRAMAHAINRDELAQTLFGNAATSLTRSMLSAVPNEAIQPIEYDPQEAMRLFDSLGLTGQTLTAVSTVVAPFPRIAEYVSNSLSELGVALDIRYYEDPPWWPAVYLETDWDIAFQGMGVRPSANVALQRDNHSAGPFNASRLRDPKLDTIIEQASVTLDAAERSELQRKAERVLHDTLPFIPLYSARACFGWNPNIEGVRTNSLGYLDFREIKAVNDAKGGLPNAWKRANSE